MSSTCPFGCGSVRDHRWPGETAWTCGTYKRGDANPHQGDWCEGHRDGYDRAEKLYRERTEQLERRLASWEPVVRDAIRGRARYLQLLDVPLDDEVAAVFARIDAIPADLLPGGEHE